MLVLENRVLQTENRELRERVVELEALSHDPDQFARDVNLETVHHWLERAGYKHSWEPAAKHVRMEFAGQHSRFTVNIQYFEGADVLFLTTRDYLRLSAAENTESVVLLLVQLAALNYEVLIGKFQLNPETGEILLSTEIHVRDGMGYDAFVHALETLCHTADARYPELERAAAGIGL